MPNKANIIIEKTSNHPQTSEGIILTIYSGIKPNSADKKNKKQNTTIIAVIDHLLILKLYKNQNLNQRGFKIQT